MRPATIEVIPTGAALGAEIRGVDLSQALGDNVFALIERAFDEHGVVFFRDQKLTPPQQSRLYPPLRRDRIRRRIFGERWSVEGSPEIVVVSNVTEDGQRVIGVKRAGENWHSDMCYTARPPRGTMLYAHEIPALYGLPLGDTEFASAAVAWEALPDDMQSFLQGRRATFDFAGRKRSFPPTQAEIDRNPPVSHPIARTHLRTGRRMPPRDARRLHRDRRDGGCRSSKGADRRACRPYRQAGAHLSPSVAAGAIS